jgi:alpha-L-arabinofuranosidase
MHRAGLLLFWMLGVGVSPSLGQQATIRVDARQTVSRVSRYMTGACLEDVNHEVYGGLYSQTIFGESFQEPDPSPRVKGFTAYGGNWQVHDGIVSVSNDPGPKLLADGLELANGEVGVDVFLPGKASGVAGLIVKVREPGVGADKFIGYEISLSSEPQFLRLGRHRQNWEHIRDVPCTVPADRWVSLSLRMAEKSLEILVDGKFILNYEDREHPLASGRIGLRPYNRECRFRNLLVKAGGKQEALPFEASKQWDEGVSGMWRALRRQTPQGSFALETDRPFIGRQSQRITFERGLGEVGVENKGLNRWGMYLVADQPYEGYLWLRAKTPGEVVVALESGDGGRVYAQSRLTVGTGDWRRLDFTLTPNATDKAGRFAVKLDRPGSVVLGHAFLQPGPWGRFKGLPVRRDVAEALVEQGLTVLRYGGSMVNAPEYRWKKMIGPRDRRPPYHGTWYPYSSNGWGILDFLDFCEAAGFLAIPALHMDETPQDLADFVEYVNGPADSPWGRKRATDGHPTPYRLKYVELGNEEAVDEEYWKRFKPLAEAAWAKDAELVLVVGDFAYNDRIKDPFHFPGAPRIKSLAAHKKILQLAQTHGRKVWFDVHVWNHEPRHPKELGGGIIGLRDFGSALKQLCPGADFRVCVFEENAVNHTLRRGLAHAHAINELERSGDLVPIVCAANCLQPDRQNDNGWDQGLLFLSPSQVWGQPSYYVTQMVSRNYLPRCVQAEVHSPGDALDVTAKTSEDGKVLLLQVVNLEAKAVKASLTLEGFRPTTPTARITELAGTLDAENTPDNPRRIVPKTRDWAHGCKDGTTEYTFAPYSFSILRFE